MTLDPDAAALVAQVVATNPPTLQERGVAGAREYLEANAARGPRGPEVAQVEDREADGVPVRIYRPASDAALPIVTYFHGGGWVIGSIATADAFARWLAVFTPCVVVSVDYRLAPDAPWPAAVDDATAAVRWVGANAAELGATAEHHVVLGDSAGGNVATIAVRKLLDAVPVRRQILAYPTIATDQRRPSHAEHGTSWPLLSSDLAWFVEQYVPDPAHRQDPDVTPLAADVTGMPRTTLILAGSDPLRDEGLDYAEHLRGAGVPVDVHVFHGQIHGFVTMAPEVLPTAGEALGLVANAIRRA